MKKAKKMMKNRKGFTLIELIVVIVIIGILAAIIIPRLAGFSDRAEASSCIATQRTMETAAAAIYADTGAYPAIAALEADTEYFATAPACPAAGDYSLDATTGKVSCSIAEHN